MAGDEGDMSHNDDPTPPPAVPAKTDEEFYRRHLEAAERDLRRAVGKGTRALYKRIIARQKRNLEALGVL